MKFHNYCLSGVLIYDTTIKNSAEFAKEAKSWTIGTREIQASFDVVAMYPSIPIKATTTVIMDMLMEDFDNVKNRTPLKLKHIKLLIDLCLENSYFMWEDEIRQLIDADPIGLSLMVVIAEGFIQSIEERAFTIARAPPNPVAPITHRRYVDDSHDRFSTKRKSEKFLDILNSIEPKIQFTVEYEDENQTLNFLDTSIRNNGQGKYEFSIHRKSAITNVQIKPNSCHNDKTKFGVFKGFVHRAKSICSEQYLTQELEFLVNIFVENGYEEKTLRKIMKNYLEKSGTKRAISNKFVSLPYVPTISNALKKVFKTAGYTAMFKSGRTLSATLTSRNKPKLPQNSYPGVYKISCRCQGNYIGHTGKKVLTRKKEHQKAVFEGNWDESALAKHCETCQNEIDWDDARTISTEPQYYRRTIRESLEIQREEVGNQENRIINDRAGLYVTTDTWKPFLKKIGKETNR